MTALSVRVPLRTGVFTSEENEYLRANWQTMTPTTMAAALGRDRHSVRNRVWLLKLTKAPAPWTEEEIATLRAAYGEVAQGGAVNLAALVLSLGRAEVTVCRKARALGLTNMNRPKLPPGTRRANDPMFSDPEERRRYSSERQRLFIATNGHPRGALGMKHSQATKDLIAEQARSRWERMTQEEKDAHVLKAVKARRDAGIPFANPRGNWKAAWREVGPQRCFFRSRWEANYARYLEWLRTLGEIQSWEHEAQTFWFEGIRRGCVSYLPDFKVINKDGAVQWHEVKGWMDARSKTVIARMGRYHPKETLIVIREKQYKEIKRKVSALIPGWEA